MVQASCRFCPFSSIVKVCLKDDFIVTKHILSNQRLIYLMSKPFYRTISVSLVAYNC